MIPSVEIYDPDEIIKEEPLRTRSDSLVKQQLLHTHFPTPQRRDLIHAVIDDRPSVIRMWMEEGLKVIDVGDGIDF